MADQEQFMVEDAQIRFRNFSGNEGKFNKEGERNFAVLLSAEVAEAMANDGWNVKMLQSREEGESDQAYIQIKVGYKIRPPRITMITSKARTNLNQESVGILDWADIQTCDLIAVGSNWEVNGKTGKTAYLKTMFVTIDEDDLERKYAVEINEEL